MLTQLSSAGLAPAAAPRTLIHRKPSDRCRAKLRREKRRNGMSFAPKTLRLVCQMAALAACALLAGRACPQTQPAKPKTAAEKAAAQPAKPRLVVVIVVDQMRADYVDKFRGQWTAGLKRLVGPRRAKDGDLHERSQRKEHRLRWRHGEWRRFRGADAASLFCRRAEVP